VRAPVSPLMPYLHVCLDCEEAWRDRDPKPSPCPDCGTPRPVGDIVHLNRKCKCTPGGR
jgi:hypothetical protein